MHLHLENGISEFTIYQQSNHSISMNITVTRPQSIQAIHIVYQYTQSKQCNDLRMDALRHDSIAH